MLLNNDQVQNIAKLARLAIDEKQQKHYAESLGGILDLVAQMDAVNTEGVEPMAHPQDAIQRLRDDVVTEANDRDEYQKLAPNTEKGLYLVPKVME